MQGPGLQLVPRMKNAFQQHGKPVFFHKYFEVNHMRYIWRCTRPGIKDRTMLLIYTMGMFDTVMWIGSCYFCTFIFGFERSVTDVLNTVLS